MLDILAVGELNVDMILAGLTEPPAPGCERIATEYALCMGSSTAITACVSASLGLRTGFAGRLGEDAYGEVVRSALSRYGVDARYVVANRDFTTGITVSMACRSDRAMVTYPGDTICDLSAEEVPLERVEARHVHVGSYFLQNKLRPDLPELFRRAHAKGMTTSLDAGWDDSGAWDPAIRLTLAHTDFFFPNEEEAKALTGEVDPQKAALRLAENGCTVAVKLGAKGCVAARGGEIFSHSGYAVVPVDTTGAGDSFNAGFLYAYLQGYPPEEWVRYGNASGAVSVTRMGGSTNCPALSDVLALISGR